MRMTKTINQIVQKYKYIFMKNEIWNKMQGRQIAVFFQDEKRINVHTGFPNIHDKKRINVHTGYPNIHDEKND